MTNVTQLPRHVTVVLMRGYRFEHLPGHEADPETDTYTAYVTAATVTEALKLAKAETLAADQKSYGKALMKRMQFDADDYHYLLMFAGHQPAIHYGWQTIQEWV